MSFDMGMLIARGCALAAIIALTPNAGMAQSTQGTAPPATNHPLDTRYWKAIELAGKPTPAQDANREAHLVFQAGGRVSGSDGCNRLMGTYELKGEGIAFGQTAGTQMACVGSGNLEQEFHAALSGARRWKISGDRLELFSAAGARLAVFQGRDQTPAPTASPSLQGTAWQLVRFKGSDDRTLTPDDRAKYTIEFGAGGRLSARIDCNRGRGTWKSPGSSQLQLGPLALTRAACPPGSLHDQIVTQWANIRSFVIKGGHLYLALMADGGIYEFEPIAVSAK